MSSSDKKPMVVLDVDGVLNGYSNHRFYAQFIYHSVRELSKIHGKRQLLKKLPELRKAGGFNALFVFAKEFCGNDEKFEYYKRNLIKKLDFNLISHDPSMKKLITRLSNYGNICIRSDGLNDIATAAWKRIIENKSSAQIKIEAFSEKDNNARRLSFDGKEIFISGIEDNNFKTKTDIESWKSFSDKHNVDLSKSVLLDDSRSNTNTAKLLDMTTIHISKLDSLLQNSPLGTVFKSSLSDVLGEKISKQLSNYQLSYGKKVDIKTLFNALLKGNTKPKTNSVQKNITVTQR